MDADCAGDGLSQLREALGVDAIKLEVVPAWANPDAKRFHIRAEAPSPGMLQAVRAMVPSLETNHPVSGRRIQYTSFTGEELEADQAWEDVVFR